MKKRIFISYNWNDSEDVNQIDSIFSRFQINLIRDIRDLKYNKNIHEFMDGIRNCDYLILYVSNSYLKSVNCMYEASQILGKSDKVVIILKRDTHVFDIADKNELVDYWKQKSVRILEMDQTLYEQETEDIQIATNAIVPFIDLIKRDNRMYGHKLDFDVLMSTLQIEKKFPDIITSVVYDWIFKYPSTSLLTILSLINDLYASSFIEFSEFPNIPTKENSYIFQQISFNQSTNGINLQICFAHKDSGNKDVKIYSGLIRIEENSMRSAEHSKFYFHCENLSKKEDYIFFEGVSKYKKLTREENEKLTKGYIDTYRIIIRKK